MGFLPSHTAFIHFIDIVNKAVMRKMSTAGVINPRAANGPRTFFCDIVTLCIMKNMVVTLNQETHFSDVVNIWQ
jgi:hypothetical protein